MKHISIKIVIFAAVLLTLAPGCSKLLDEQPRSFFDPGYFKTEKGVYGGITSLYAHLRFIYGQPYFYNALETGTDEYTWGQSADANFRDMDLSGVGNLTPQSSRSDVLWPVAFANINTANGIIENAEANGNIPASLIAEAYFFRAFDYFLLVQTFGGVPLDLGAGELKFNTSAVRTSVRNTVPEVYTRAIFPDLLKAIDELPARPRTTGTATKTLARLYLAKAYLTYAWWLENPNSIPTYPEADRVDPDGHNAQWYFQKAYDVAVQALDDPADFGLETTFYDLHRGGNDRNKEVLLYADHTQENEFYNGACLSCFSGEAGQGQNTAVWMVTFNYTLMKSGSEPGGTGDAIFPVQREAAQGLGRPYVRMAPIQEVFKNTFADKTTDSRYDGTFSLVFRANWPKGGTPNTVLYNANDMEVYPGDRILTFLDRDTNVIQFPAGENVSFPGRVSNGIGAGQMPGRADWVMGPGNISRVVFPGLWKLGVYRTDNGTGLGQPNAGSTRPFKIARFAELYFIAAEAAVKGATTVTGKTAFDLISQVRARAGRWKFSNRDNAPYEVDKSADMIAATPTTITINYILEERSREFFGEGYRWFDLVRTQKWNELAGSYTICGDKYHEHTPVTYNRTIMPFHYLRPIPQNQIDRMAMSPEEKAAYQNPGYD